LHPKITDFDRYYFELPGILITDAFSDPTIPIYFTNSFAIVFEYITGYPFGTISSDSAKIKILDKDGFLIMKNPENDTNILF